MARGEPARGVGRPSGEQGEDQARARGEGADKSYARAGSIYSAGRKLQRDVDVKGGVTHVTLE